MNSPNLSSAVNNLVSKNNSDCAGCQKSISLSVATTLLSEMSKEETIWLDNFSEARRIIGGNVGNWQGDFGTLKSLEVSALQRYPYYVLD